MRSLMKRKYLNFSRTYTGAVLSIDVQPFIKRAPNLFPAPWEKYPGVLTAQALSICMLQVMVMNSL